jgi:molecular chaperone DnaK (HSP70)
MRTIGIDLGTTYSAVATVRSDGSAAVIADAAGAELTPSVVGVVDGEMVVGAEAKAAQAAGEQAAAFFKRSMGEPGFQLELGGRTWSPVDLSAQVLGHLAGVAAADLRGPVELAVVTVPEYFTDPQRRATLAAAAQAGLYVPRLVSEPVAAALAYGLRPHSGERTVLVYDLGGGTFDIALVRIEDAELRVLGARGNHELGGRDWDDRLAQVVADRLSAQLGLDVAESEPLRLLVEIERLKRSLSVRQSAELRFTANGRTGSTTVTRVDFEAVGADLVEQTAQLTAAVLGDAGLGWGDVEGVLPVGGSTRMPMIRRWIEEASGKPTLAGVHPEHAVALGAAVRAALLTEPSGGALAAASGRTPAGGSSGLLAPRTVRDIVAHSLGMIAESADRKRYINSILLPRNLPIPCTEERPYQFELRGDGTDVLEVFLTQGERDHPATCAYLGRYVVTGFPTGSTGPAVVDVAYSYDDNAIVDVRATERATGTVLDVRVEDLPEDVPDRFLEAPPAVGARGAMTVYLAFDLSGSMSGPPLAAAKAAAESFVSQLDLSSTAVGLIEFSDRVHVASTAGQDASRIGEAISSMTVGSTGGGNAGHPFDQLFELLDGVEGRRFGIVLADGVWSNQQLAISRAQRCHEHGIDIVAIGFGGADRVFLDAIASSDATSVFTDIGGLTSAFSTIARELIRGLRV